VSISQTFYEQLLRKNPFAKKLQTQIVSAEMLGKKLLYKKAARKMFIILSPGILLLGEELLANVVIRFKASLSLHFFSHHVQGLVIGSAFQHFFLCHSRCEK
jgi:hypothetical protein